MCELDVQQCKLISWFKDSAALSFRQVSEGWEDQVGETAGNVSLQDRRERLHLQWCKTYQQCKRMDVMMWLNLWCDMLKSSGKFTDWTFRSLSCWVSLKHKNNMIKNKFLSNKNTSQTPGGYSIKQVKGKPRLKWPCLANVSESSVPSTWLRLAPHR